MRQVGTVTKLRLFDKNLGNASVRQVVSTSSDGNDNNIIIILVKP